MSRLFISDLHLENEESARYLAFLKVLDSAINSKSDIYILGDLVEVWIGDDDDSSFAQKLLTDIRRCTEHIDVYVMQGNRDFLYRQEFATKTRSTLLADPHVLIAPDLNEPILLSHGDAYCTSDTDYMQARALFRSQQWQNQILSSSLEDRRALARSLRERSVANNELKADNILDVVEDDCLADMTKHDCRLLIHGHTHRPGVHLLGDVGRRIVLGDWEYCGWYLKEERGEFSLVRFAIDH